MTEFVLDLAENPHPRLLAGARARRGAAIDLIDRLPLSREAVAARSEWRGYLAAMADATGCDPADLIAWMDRQ